MQGQQAHQVPLILRSSRSSLIVILAFLWRLNLHTENTFLFSDSQQKKKTCSQDCSLTLNISLVFCCSLGVIYLAVHPSQQSKKRIPGSVYTVAFLQLSLSPLIQLLCVQHQITMLFFYCHLVLQPYELATYI